MKLLGRYEMHECVDIKVFFFFFSGDHILVEDIILIYVISALIK